MAIVSLYACQNQSAEASARWDEVMAIHDEVMPKMGKIRSVSKSLKEMITAADSLTLATEDYQKIMPQLSKLQAADDAMMDWMHGFLQLERLQADKTHEEVMKYLDEEEVKIKAVKTAMETSIKNGNALLETLKSPAE